jgi:hypothetical protein
MRSKLLLVRSLLGWRRWGAMLRLGVHSALGRFHICMLGILTKWSSFTRLETRTKESYIYASNLVGNWFAD